MTVVFDLASLIKAKTRDEFLTSLLDVAASIGLNTTAWQSGGWTRTILTLTAQVASDLVTSLVIEPIRGGFGDLQASDDWADAWAGSFDNTRRPATAASTDTYRIINPSNQGYTLQIGDLIVAHATTGKTYRNRAIVNVPALTTVDNVVIDAVELGSGSNAAAGQITTLVSPSMPGVTVTNPAAAIGADKETTPNLVTRTRGKFASFSSNGPKSAYDYVVTTPSYNPTVVPITRSKTYVDPATGDITVYVATSAGAPSAGDVTISTTSIQKWVEPWGGNSVAAAAVNKVIPVTYQVWLKGSSLTAAAAQAAIDAALAAYFATIPIGGDELEPDPGKVFRNALTVVIANATPGVKQVGITAPAADVTLLASEVPILGTVTATINFLPS